MNVTQTLGRTRDGGSCAGCGGDYVGAPYVDNGRRGYRVLVEVEPGLEEPANICPDCYSEHVDDVDGELEVVWSRLEDAEPVAPSEDDVAEGWDA